MSDFLVAYLDAIDERLLDYLDENDELSVDTVVRLRLYANELLSGLITPTHLVEEWPDWFDLSPAFVAAYAPELQELEDAASIPNAADKIPQGHGAVLDERDWAYLAALELRLDRYPQIRNLGDGEPGE